MRALQRLQQELAGFIAEQEHGICVLHGEREQLPWVYAAVQEIAVTRADPLLPFPHPFVSADAYAETIAEGILGCAREQTSMEGLMLPSSCVDRAQPAIERVRRALVFARETMLPAGACPPRIVPILAPLTVEDEAALLAFARELIAVGAEWPPWFSRMRIFAHVPSAASLGELPCFVRALAVDLSSAALEAAVAEEARDPQVLPTRRAETLLQAAAIDAARGRHVEAIAGYREVHAWAETAPNPVLAALALNGIGDVESVQKDMNKAAAWYERALVPASETGAAIVMLIVTRNLARAYAELDRHAEAETFWDGAQRLAMMVPDAMSHAEALHWRGRLQERRGAANEAAVSYLAAARVAHECDHGALLNELRPRLATSGSQVAPEIRHEIAQFLGGVP